MGLDITAFKNLKEIQNPQRDEDGDLVNWNTEWSGGEGMKWAETHFPGRGEGIDPDKVYTYDDSFEFRAGSYSGYGWWRDVLSEFSDGTSFGELVDFADNEGVIGFVVSKKLYNDFATNKEKAKEYSKTINDGEYWFEKYCEWEDAFKMAAENGAVDFH